MSNEKENKLKSLQATIDRLDKTYGKGTIMRLGDKQAVEVETIPSGSLGLDMALGCYGYPKGRIIEIYGPESSGKTTLAIHAVAECQKKAVSRLSSMRSTLSTAFMPNTSGSTSTTC